MRSLLVLLALALLVAGCGGGSGSKTSSGLPVVGAARTYRLVDFKPTSPAVAGKPTLVSFVIRQPNGQPLTKFKTGPGPHTGVHLIIVRRDLATIVHRHPPIAKNGVISLPVTFTEPGPYRVVVDAYPATNGPQRNFQLFSSLRVAGTYVPKPLPPFRASETIDGYHITMHGTPELHAIQAGLLTISITDAHGKPVHFTPWYGALAHAIFFRKGTLDYFHTHVCAPGASGCTSVLGGATVTGTSATPGLIKVGVLVPVAGTWRLFLQFQQHGTTITAPFTLTVGS